MKGLVYLGDGRAEVTDELEVRDPHPNEVVVRIVAAGFCHTDASILDGTIPWPAPTAMGHEGAGIVDRVGSAVTRVRPGDHVVVSTVAYCGACRACVTGYPSRCRSSIGNTTQPFTFRGAPCSNFAGTSSFTEYTVVQEVQAVPFAADIPLHIACVVACGVLTGSGAVWNTAKVRPGATAVVFGLGGVGLSAIRALALSQASRIIAVDLEPKKEALARRFGATDFINAATDELAASIRELIPYSADAVVGPFNAGGVDFAFDCVGSPTVLGTAIDVLDWGGTAVAVGYPRSDARVSVSIPHLLTVDRRVLGCRIGESKPHHDIPVLLDLYRRGQFPLDELVSKTYPLEQWPELMNDLHSGDIARGVLTI